MNPFENHPKRGLEPDGTEPDVLRHITASRDDDFEDDDDLDDDPQGDDLEEDLDEEWDDDDDDWDDDDDDLEENDDDFEDDDWQEDDVELEARFLTRVKKPRAAPVPRKPADQKAVKPATKAGKPARRPRSTSRAEGDSDVDDADD